MFPTNPENAAIIERLADALATLSIGAVLSYERAEQIAGRDVRDKNRHLMEAAREVAERRLGCIFECVRTVGVKRLSASECPEVGLSAMRRVRSAAKRGLKRLSRLNTNSLSDGENRRTLSYRAMLGAVALVADGNKARSLAAVIDPVSPVPPKNVLQMFGKDD